jgi:SAM-dependent methyltransferase
MFSASHALYDLIYSSFVDYPAAAAVLATQIRRANPSAQTVLDVACGTGEHARLLTEAHAFAVDGLDLDPEFVRIARGKLPGATIYEGDMTSFDLERRYDVVLCLFSSIGYVRTLENVERTFARFRHHLADGGIVIVEPWFPPGSIEAGRVSVKTVETPDVTVCRMSHMTVEGRISRLRFEYLIGRRRGVERAEELHELGLFTTEETLNCFRRAGLEAEHDPNGPLGRGLFLARKAG